MDASLHAYSDWLATAPLHEVMAAAARVRDRNHGKLVTYSRKAFIPLTQLCRDVCHYCTFAKNPSELPRPYLLPEEVLAIAKRARQAGCKEALFTLGDKPELRHEAARVALAAMGYATTVDYLEAACRLVLEETGLLPHVNAGVLSAGEMARLRRVSASQGLMLESTSEALGRKGGPHHGSPDKDPALRLRAIDEAGELAIPFTSGLLLGIGESFADTVDGLVALNALHQRHGHLQEVIVQNFVPKQATRLGRQPALDHERHLRAIAAARLILAPEISVQAPPNLTPGLFGGLLAAGIDDWGGVSPVTPDHVNPECPWPLIAELEATTRTHGHILAERLTVYPRFLASPARWLDPQVQPRVLPLHDSDGLAREDDWLAGRPSALPALPAGPAAPEIRGAAARLVERVLHGPELAPGEIHAMFSARGADANAVFLAADDVRARVNADAVSYVVNRNVNYTNLCIYSCGFCAFSKSSSRSSPRDTPYDIADEELARRVREAWDRGASEVCLQGGIHPEYTGQKYLDLLRIAKDAAPGIHIHAFSPLEVLHGATTLGLPVRDFLAELKAAGLSTLPGTAAEILSDEVRQLICPDKLTSDEWIGVMRAAHETGLRTTSTIMFGHVDRTRHWVEHLVRIRDLQKQTGGFTEFVPLPFIHDEAPLNRRGHSRHGPTLREALLMHAVARLALHRHIDHVQVSWVKMGPEGAARALQCGADDLGGTLTNESISRAAGTRHGQEMSPARLEDLIASIGRQPRPRTTLYEDADPQRVALARGASAAAPIELTPVRKGRYRTHAIVAA